MAKCPKCGVAVAPDVKFCPGCGASVAEPAGAPVQQRTQTGLQPNVAGALCYLVGWLSGLVLFLVEKDRFIRFHAVQSMIVFGGIQILQFLLVWVPGLFGLVALLRLLLSLAQLGLWIFLMIKAYNNELYKLPVVGDLAEQYSAK